MQEELHFKTAWKTESCKNWCRKNWKLQDNKLQEELYWQKKRKLKQQETENSVATENCFIILLHFHTNSAPNTFMIKQLIFWSLQAS